MPAHWAELQASGIAADLAAVNVASFGPGTDRHWETERSELIRFARLTIQTQSKTASGFPQCQPGHLTERLSRLDQRYRHLSAGGWRSLSATLPGLEPFDQWKCDQPRDKPSKRDRRGQWQLELDRLGRPKPLKYESPPGDPDGGGLLLPNVPEAYWRLICEHQDLPFPDPVTVSGGFWPWAQQTPALEILVTEGWKKALAAVTAGYAAVAVPGVTMGIRRCSGVGFGKDSSSTANRRLIPALQALASPDRHWRIAFDTETKPDTKREVCAAAGALASSLRTTGGRVVVCRLPLLPGTDKTGLDDIFAATGSDGIAQALTDPPILPALPDAPIPHRIAPAGQYLADGCPIPPPSEAQLVIIRAPMGCGKTEAIAAALAPLAADGVPILMPSHRQGLGQAAAERIGVPWRPEPGTPERQQGIAACLDSWSPDSELRITGSGWHGGVMVLDEWAQQVEHLLFSTGTALSDRSGRRAQALRTLTEHLLHARQIIAADAQLPLWAVRLAEQLRGRESFVIGSEWQPMAGRILYCPSGFRTAADAAAAFRCRWWEMVTNNESFLCWTSAQQAGFRNAPQTLAALHRLHRPEDADRIAVIDSSTPELTAQLAADPDGFAKRFPIIYASPSISSGVSFSSWKPSAVICYSGGRIGPEHVAQAAARVRCPDVPVWLFAPDHSPGAGLRVCSGATNPDQLIEDLRLANGSLYAELQSCPEPFLQAWGEIGALRNRQHYAYQATISALLTQEGWSLQSTGPDYDHAIAAQLAKDLGAIADAAQLAADTAVLTAEPLDPERAHQLETARRRLEPQETAALNRHRLLRRWGLLESDHSPTLTTDAGLALLKSDRDGLWGRLRLGWLLTTPDAAAMVPEHDWQQIVSLDPTGRQPFAPDRLRVTDSSRLVAFVRLGIPDLLQRFAAGELIAANDPDVLQLHSMATAHRRQLRAATGLSPGRLATGTLRTMLRACGWRLERAGRIKRRGADRDLITYRAAPVALPAGVDRSALIAAWRRELQQPSRRLGHFSPIDGKLLGEKVPQPPPGSPPGPPRPGWLALIRALPSPPDPESAPPAPVPIPS